MASQQTNVPPEATTQAGTTGPYQNIIVAFCRALVDAIWGIINKEPKKCDLEIWIVTTNEAVLDTFEKMLDIGDGSKLTNTKPDLGSSKLENQKTDDKTLDEDCCICMDKITDPKWLPCKHVFCTDCIDQQFKFKPACPQCGAVHGIVTGDQPPGTISRKKLYFSLPGYPEYQTIAITYTFSSGYQSEEHPYPGQPYTGISRTGYLPDNEKGRLVAKLLQVAFDRRLVFTIGRSRTTGQIGVITWNDIHHKTRTHGGQQSFGYPDDTYLDRVLDELAAKGFKLFRSLIIDYLCLNSFYSLLVLLAILQTHFKKKIYLHINIEFDFDVSLFCFFLIFDNILFVKNLLKPDIEDLVPDLVLPLPIQVTSNFLKK
ncbi:hypothetical protein KUTeg_005776 [Tegillarca granosa]|uniref:E3 ubiquitin-protein ligase n=1 Tax=Tegillarca granosa TaxID=220873 RepID=A0ABQ9FH70_TEGGR|nr:hypothetical protein KUTeg_005776 [Tegillarca granosa]